jgi:hypothetical protein
MRRFNIEGDGYFGAEGTWVVPDDPKDWPFNSVKIKCPLARSECEEIIAFLPQPGPTSILPAQAIFHPHRKTGATHRYPAKEENSYSIARLSATELVAERRQGCDLLTLRLGFSRKK